MSGKRIRTIAVDVKLTDRAETLRAVLAKKHGVELGFGKVVEAALKRGLDLMEREAQS